MKDKILFIDTETGGLIPGVHSLLSIGLVVWCENEILDTLELNINDGALNVTEQALKINKINIEEHRRNSITPNIAFQKIIDFIQIHFDVTTSSSITLGGHNINFDVNFLKHFFEINRGSFSAYFSHRYLDTSSILYYLYLSGKLSKKVISSSDAFDYFGIKVENRHTALGDAVATAELFSKLILLSK